MTFKQGDRVEITRCADDPRAAGKVGRIVDGVAPGHLTGGRWTVGGLGLFQRPVLCTSAELRKV
ncbi:hypothetical protein [Streptomyces bohaiensis]|uniref:DUF1918 domain-containing protein n=1 Tax=Streptomyces bohaiensis TaxID=1431344 RepID=A0ABX1C8G6_9ACTN|nr:hypothetical protein [Streptomyces bohaiensis]NJQ13522.1 hypothetical protein [Streptomyces bohaiensis]